MGTLVCVVADAACSYQRHGGVQQQIMQGVMYGGDGSSLVRLIGEVPLQD